MQTVLTTWPGHLDYVLEDRLVVLAWPLGMRICNGTMRPRVWPGGRKQLDERYDVACRPELGIYGVCAFPASNQEGYSF